MITVKLPPDLEAAMAEMVRETGQSAEQIALDALLERLEDFSDVKTAEERLRHPSGPGIPLEEVMRNFGLLDAEGETKKPAAE